MRSFLLFVLMTISLNAFCQKNDRQVILNKGQKFTVKTMMSQEADMGMGMEMKNFTTSQTNFIVLDIADNNYSISSTLTGMKVSMDFMGQQTTYDSDLKSDSASEIGKSMKDLNVPDTVTVNKYTAKVTDNKVVTVSKEENANPMEDLFESLGDNNKEASISEAFFVMPAGKKSGDSWVDSSSTKDMKSLKTYTIKSIDKNIAIINIIGNVVSNIQSEVQGLQVNVSMTTKTDSEVIADTKTSLVTKRTTKADINGNLELMGQSQPITGKATTTSVYEY